MVPDVSPEDWARLASMAEESLDHPHPDTPSFISSSTGAVREVFKTLFMSGQWLTEKLIEAGASDDEAASICFAHGQRSFGRDPWQIAQEQLQRWNQGIADKPGEELANELLDQMFRKSEGSK